MIENAIAFQKDWALPPESFFMEKFICFDFFFPIGDSVNVPLI